MRDGFWLSQFSENPGKATRENRSCENLLIREKFFIHLSWIGLPLGRLSSTCFSYSVAFPLNTTRDFCVAILQLYGAKIIFCKEIAFFELSVF